VKREYKDFESQVDDFLVQRQEQLLDALSTIAAKDARIAKLEKDREIPWTDR
jgi:hypothetical protein